MEKSYYLEDISIRHNEDPRHFLIPTDKEIDSLKVGEIVRLFFVLRFEIKDNCRAERMWVEISEIDSQKSFKGYLTNQPVYIADLNIGDIISFTKENIATVIIPAPFDEKKKAIITLKALQKQEINWVMRDKPNNSYDSGWRLFYGDEEQEYLDNPNKSTIIVLENILEFEPRLENAFLSQHTAFEWDQQRSDFIEVYDYVVPED